MYRRQLIGTVVMAAVALCLCAPARADETPPAAQVEPPKLVVESPAAYPEELKATPKDGQVDLEIVVGEDGSVLEWKVLSATDPLFEAAAARAVPGLKFEPATLNGHPVAVKVSFSYRFLAPSPPPAPPATPAAENTEAPATGLVEGTVRSRGTRIPIPEAWVALGDGEAVRCDAAGHFSLAVPSEVDVELKVHAAGFKERSFREKVKPGERVEVVYALDPIRVNPYETVVRADRLRTEVSRVTLEAKELRETPGTMGDPFRVVMLMPGVTGLLSGVAYPIVRGTAPADTGYFLDGVRVPMLFHLFLGPAVVHPDFIEGLDFYAGSPPTRYGRLLAGVIDGRTAQPRDDRVHVSAYADLINAGAFVEVPISATGTDITVAGRYSYTGGLIALMSNLAAAGEDTSKTVLNFWDYQARVDQALLGGKLRLFAFGSSDEVGVSDTTSTVAFHRVDARYQHPLLGGLLEVGATWGLDELGIGAQASAEAEGQYGLKQTTWSARSSWTSELGKGLSLSLNADMEHRGSQVTMSGDMGSGEISIEQPAAIGTFFGLGAELVWSKKGWTVVPGVRLDSYHLVPGIQHASLEPRLTVRKELLDTLTFKGAAGLFHQAPTMLIQIPAVDTAALRYGLQEAVQVDVGLEWKIIDGLDLTVDAYVNPLLRTVEIDPFDSNADQSNPASRGLAYGLEIMLRHPLGGRWFGWLSYSLQRSTRYTTFTTYDASGNPSGQSAADLPYAYDQTHVLNAVVSYQLPLGWTVGVVFHLNTGRPESGILTSQTMRPGTSEAGPTWVMVSRDQADRLPVFFRVDVRVAKTWVFDSYLFDLYLDVLNASFQSETIGFEYRGGYGGPLTKTATGVPLILPVLGLKATY